MDVNAILIGLAVSIVVGVALADPILKNKQTEIEKSAPNDDDPKPRDRGVMSTLRELDFDFEIGNIDDLDYQYLRAQLISDAAEILRAKDRGEAQLEERLEQEIRARRRSSLECMICPQCGVNLNPQDRFCSRCGSKIESSCRFCGSVAEIGDENCSACGKPIESIIGAKR